MREAIFGARRSFAILDRPARLFIAAQERAFKSVAVLGVVVISLWEDVINDVAPHNTSHRVSAVGEADPRGTQAGSVTGSVDLHDLDAPGGDVAV